MYHYFSQVVVFFLMILASFVSSSLESVILDDSFDLGRLKGKRLGYYTGSFDPIHLGHQHLIEASLHGGLVLISVEL